MNKLLEWKLARQNEFGTEYLCWDLYYLGRLVLLQRFPSQLIGTIPVPEEYSCWCFIDRKVIEHTFPVSKDTKVPEEIEKIWNLTRLKIIQNTLHKNFDFLDHITVK